MSAQVAADLRAAADVLERDGWTQGTFTDKRTGCHCVAGALAEIHPTAAISQRWIEAIEALAIHVGVNPWPTDVYRWNDHPDRDVDQVITALREAADKAEAQNPR